MKEILLENTSHKIFCWSAKISWFHIQAILISIHVYRVFFNEEFKVLDFLGAMYPKF